MLIEKTSKYIPPCVNIFYCLEGIAVGKLNCRIVAHWIFWNVLEGLNCIGVTIFLILRVHVCAYELFVNNVAQIVGARK